MMVTVTPNTFTQLQLSKEDLIKLMRSRMRMRCGARIPAGERTSVPQGCTAVDLEKKQIFGAVVGELALSDIEIYLGIRD